MRKIKDGRKHKSDWLVQTAKRIQYKMKKQIDIIPVPMKSEDARGQVHFFSTERSGEYMVFYRKAGAIGARHYHKG